MYVALTHQIMSFCDSKPKGKYEKPEHEAREEKLPRNRTATTKNTPLPPKKKQLLFVWPLAYNLFQFRCWPTRNMKVPVGIACKIIQRHN